jgi:hypothetical protein
MHLFVFYKDIHLNLINGSMTAPPPVIAQQYSSATLL